jgi:hypothetical protein
MVETIIRCVSKPGEIWRHNVDVTKLIREA